jgi:hypothetical protein
VRKEKRVGRCCKPEPPAQSLNHATSHPHHIHVHPPSCRMYPPIPKPTTHPPVRVYRVAQQQIPRAAKTCTLTTDMSPPKHQSIPIPISILMLIPHDEPKKVSNLISSRLILPASVPITHIPVPQLLPNPSYINGARKVQPNPSQNAPWLLRAGLNKRRRARL